DYYCGSWDNSGKHYIF
nr:immunoglobulin light chain junction region [Macaca mulatta]MOX16678.1 immunoglobulin light chain junction region [Macaca mulatta]MOX16704.1 immunoglobulin light chain junction region [Macaca mulatta]MOX16747.1 immunoglobulin light chain junction region [Macaca mulatta]MOX16845.1 immunoglobulin light chain junction region [Macaca mulatta]